MPGPNIVRWRSVCGSRRASSPNLDEWSVSKMFIYKKCWLFLLSKRKLGGSCSHGYEVQLFLDAEQVNR